MATPQEVVLIVEDKNKPTGQEKEIQAHLTSALGCSVSVEEPACSFSQHLAAKLVVVCAKRVAPEIRRLEIPVLVCNVSALYELGMTKDEKNQHGTQAYSTVRIRGAVIGGLTSGDRPMVTEDKAP